MRADKKTIEELRAELLEYERVFELQQKAQQRAIDAWRAGHPERDIIFPDHTKLIAWLLDRLDGAPMVHGLRDAMPSCRFTFDVPGSWPPGHKWARITEPERNLITCAACRRALKMDPKEPSDLDPGEWDEWLDHPIGRGDKSR